MTTRFPCRRRGTATIEFVIALPILLLLAALLLSLGWTSIDRSEAALEARHALWSARLRPDQVRPDEIAPGFRRSTPFDLGPSSGQLSAIAKTDAHVHQAWGRPREAESGASLLAETWDYRQIPFAGKWPHASVLVQLAEGTGGTDYSVILDNFQSQLLAIISDSLIEALQQQIAAAKQQLIAEIDELEVKLNEARAFVRRWRIGSLPIAPPAGNGLPTTVSGGLDRLREALQLAREKVNAL